MKNFVFVLASALWIAHAGFAVAAAAGMASSASKVRMTAEHADSGQAGNADTIAVHLEPASGWHVNANPASLKFLIPTKIQARAGDQNIPVTVDYPPGHDAGIELGGKPIKVYSGDTTIPVRLDSDAVAAARKAGAVRIDARVQACSTKGICLPPSQISARVGWP